MAEGKDLSTSEFPKVDWDDDKLTSSLDKIYVYVVNKATRSELWYFHKKTWKKWCGWALRGTAIVAAAVAGILPVLDGIYKDSQSVAIEPGWATILIALAGLCVMLDRFGGYTSGWVRYVLTAQKIGEELESFQFDWDAKKARLAGTSLSADQAREFLADAQQFAAKVGELVAEETSQWATEFEGTLRQIEAAAKAVAKPAKHGAVGIAVKNGSQSHGGWKLQIGERDPVPKSGNRASVNKLAPGLYVIRIQGEIAGKPAADEQAVEVVAGKVCEVELELVGTA